MKSKIKTFEDACKVLNIDPVLPNVELLPDLHKNAIVAHYKLITIAQALNGGWQPDWDNSKQLKYYPWFVCSGSRFSYDDYGYGRTGTVVGSRLCYKTRELAKYAGKQFEDLYRESLMFQ